MKKVTMKNFSGAEVLSKEELKNIMGGKVAPVRCQLTNGLIVDCHNSAERCIEILFNAGEDVFGCWETTPVPDLP